jgi:hypothetical protein
MILDAHSNIAGFVKGGKAKRHDKTSVRYLKLSAHRMIACDSALKDSLQDSCATAKA